MLATSQPIARGDPAHFRHPDLAELTIALADGFCMVPVYSRPHVWRSGHYELQLDEEARTVTLQDRANRGRSFRLILTIRPGSPVQATVRGTLSPRGFQDLAAADAQLDGVILSAECSPVSGPPRVPRLEPLHLVDVLEVRKRGGRQPV